MPLLFSFLAEYAIRKVQNKKSEWNELYCADDMNVLGANAVQYSKYYIKMSKYTGRKRKDLRKTTEVPNTKIY
jgi:hypothetical protein